MLDKDKENLSMLMQQYKSNEDESPIALEQGDWMIAEGGYDLWFEVYYKEVTAARCIAGKIETEECCAFMELKDRKIIKEIILDILDYLVALDY